MPDMNLPPPAAPSSRSKLYYQTDFPAAEFTERRAKVSEAIGGEALAVVQGAGATEAFDIFRQTNEFYYLCGLEVPHAYLLIDGASASSTLYLPRRDPKHERSEGATLSADDAGLVAELTGVNAVRHYDALAHDLAGTRLIFTPHSPAERRQMCRDTLLHAQRSIAADPWRREFTREEQFRQKLSGACPEAEIHDLSPILDTLRVIKSPREIEVLRRAGRICALGITAAMRHTRPGQMEYQLAAAAEYEFLVHGASGGGYRPIVATSAWKILWPSPPPVAKT